MKKIPLYDVRQINNLKDMLEQSTRISGDKAAFLIKKAGNEDYLKVSYNQFKSDVDALGTALTDIGLRGKRIALIGENRYEWAVTYMATVNGVGVIVPLDKELPQNEIENLLVRSKAHAIVFSGNNKNQLADSSKKLEFINSYINMDASKEENGILSFNNLLLKGYELLRNGNRSFIDAQINNSEMSMLLFTSGTTELSKAVMLSHANICSNLFSMSSMLYIGEDDIFLSVLPMHHTYECTCGFLCPIYRGATIAFCEGLRHIQKNLSQAKATVMLGVPLIFETMYKRIWDQASKQPGNVRKLKTALKISNFLRKLRVNISKKLFAPIHNSFGGNLRLFISGAAGVDPMAAKGFREFGIHFVQGYGLTECSPIVALNRDVDFKDNAAGIPLPIMEVKICEPNSEGIGEIIVKGPNVMIGYYENQEATQKVLKNGWFYTGDMGYIDSDEFVHITGRKKNVIITKNGKNIYPEEIETLLNRSPYIKESMVYGKNDRNENDIAVSAIIVADQEKIQEDFKDKALIFDDLYALIQNEVKAVNKSLVNYKHIKFIHLREDELAKTTTKKIKRYMENNV